MAGASPLIQGAAIATASASVGGGGIAPSSLHLTPPFHHIIPHPTGLSSSLASLSPEALLHYTFPSEADTLAYVDALKHSDLSDWRSLQEVAARAGAGSCSGAVTTSVLTALYLLGLFNLCAASPASCCVPPASGRRRRRRRAVDATLPPLLNNLQHNLSSLSLEQFRDLPHVTTPDGGRIPLHISVVDQVRKLWDSNPRLLSSVSCSSPTQSVRSSFISLSGVASGIILAYSVAQLSQCYPDHTPDQHNPPKIWFFPIPNEERSHQFPVPTIPIDIPVTGDDDNDDGCERNEVPLGDDKCALLLSAEFCPYKHWVLLNKETGMGECVPRLCADNFVYVEADGMCHDINEPGICPGNRRLYLTASGQAVCDCPEGMFPGPRDTCYYLHEPAYCPKGSVLQFDKPIKSLVCRPDPCGDINDNLWPDDLPFAPRSDGYCYQFNEQGPCKKGQRFGFDSDKLEATCVSLFEAGLVRPRRSYMYQQMSYPAASQDHQFPHYQVSYIIMNGTTWDLEVKGIGRNRRDVSSSSPGLHSVPFIDTREIQRDFHPFMKPRIPRWVLNKRHRRGSHHSKDKHSGRNETSSTVAELQVPGSDKVRERNETSRASTKVQVEGDSQVKDETLQETIRELGFDDPATSPTFSFAKEVIDTNKTTNSTRKRKRGKDSKKEGKKKQAGKSKKKNEGTESHRERDLDNLLVTIHQEQGGKNSVDSQAVTREIVKVDQSSEPVVVHQSKSSHRRGKDRSKKKRRQNRGSKGKKKKKRRRNRGKGRRRRKKKPNKSKNDKKRKNPKLPFRVPTIEPPSDNSTNITNIEKEKNVTVDDTVKGFSEDVNQITNTSDLSHKTISVDQIKSDPDGVKRTPHRVSKTKDETVVEEEREKQTSSSETSLPKYLRHRGRRQLGEGGGIIQAPLLSACKPGAKRDYNYKCRPKFIPQERDSMAAKSGSAASTTAPRSPRISCPEGTRLDPRGKCQQVS